MTVENTGDFPHVLNKYLLLLQHYQSLFFKKNMEPIFTNDAIVFGFLALLLALIFYTSKLAGWQKFYSIVPTLVLCYFLPAFLYWPLGLIAPEWFDNILLTLLAEKGLTLPDGLSFNQIKEWLAENGIEKSEYSKFIGHSELYFVASRYLLPASLLLLCISIDFKGIMRLGNKALIMFFTATIGIIIGGPIALLVISYIAPEGFIPASPDEIWRGLSTIAGSWIGGGANQAAMKEIFNVRDSLFGTMVIVDVLVANIWMAFLLYGAGISDKLDLKLKADNSAITELKERIANYRASIERMPTTRHMFMILGVAFFGVAMSHMVADIMVPWLKNHEVALKAASACTSPGPLSTICAGTICTGLRPMIRPPAV